MQLFNILVFLFSFFGLSEIGFIINVLRGGLNLGNTCQSPNTKTLTTSLKSTLLDEEN